MTNELFAKLARLRREERPAETSAPAPELPAWFTARASPTLASPGLASDVGPPRALVEQENERGRFAAREQSYALREAHGHWTLGSALEAESSELAWLARDPALAELALGRALFLDIETTGISGGAGTIPFLIALGRFEGGHFRLWQAFLRDPGEEAAALLAVAERLRSADGLVSFFGKSFDRHRLEDKMRLHRITPPFAKKPHLDLYHPLVRLYRGAFGDGRLATFESALCGVTRGPDLPGALAPAAWFDYLAARAHRLEAVFRHNELDVLSLVTLAAHLACTRREHRADGAALSGCGRSRARGLAALHSSVGEHARALAWLERAEERGGADPDLAFRRAECLRRLGEHEQALVEFLRLARGESGARAAKAWAGVLRLARRLKRSELAAEARTEGPREVERAFTGRARARALAPFQPPPSRARPRPTAPVRAAPGA